MIVAVMLLAVAITVASAYVGRKAHHYWWMGLLWFGFLPACVFLEEGTALQFISAYCFGGSFWLLFSTMFWKLGI